MAHGTRPAAEFAALLGLRPKIPRSVEPFLLSFELALGLETREHCRIIGRSRTHRTAGFLFVLAVAEATLCSDLGEVAEDLVDAGAGVPEAEFACARGVDDQSPAGQLDQLAACGCVPSPALRADVAAGKPRVAVVPVHKGRLALAAWTHEHGDEAFEQHLAQASQPGAR